ncbi:MAG: glutamine-hydrolyzing GMP synthase [Endomicrobium sp.]|jgi:GMP synthase (glutamine-hydrolysing)|nr:glutamine-hydrolyzing GMP synthase [Endomicrobium sp.]
MILILDFGSQYTQLIAKCIREEKVYCEVHPGNKQVSSCIDIRKLKGIILSGGYESVYSNSAPFPDSNIWSLGVPILGICYGMQIIAKRFGAKVIPSKNREFGFMNVIVDRTCLLFYNLNFKESFWMSHIDRLFEVPKDFRITAKSTSYFFIAAIENMSKNIYGVQFHPEVKHSINGKQILKNFIFKICKSNPNWTMESYIVNEIKRVQKQVGKSKVLCAVSGGVDSYVAAIILHKAIGKQLICIYIDHGLQRFNETKRVRKIFNRIFKENFIIINAKKEFFSKLKTVTNPEKKRKIIGHSFIKIFETEARKIKGIHFLLQGTIYSDIIESVSIKSHHNVGCIPTKMNMELVEPIKFLFKDEVRALGKKLKIPKEIINRQPFPGPGFAVRILGEITLKKINILRKADNIVIEEIKKSGIYKKIWQSFAVILPVKTVGVMGDFRTYEHVIAIRVVSSEDAMTADWVRLPYELLARMSSRIINEVRGVNRVVYDISSKPPATIEWE